MGFGIQLHNFSVVWPCKSYFITPYLSFPVFIMVIIILIHMAVGRINDIRHIKYLEQWLAQRIYAE